jgi:hypothetical protein
LRSNPVLPNHAPCPNYSQLKKVSSIHIISHIITHHKKKKNYNKNATAPSAHIANTGTVLFSAAPVACAGLTNVLDVVGVTVGLGIVYEKLDFTVVVGFGAAPVPVGRMMVGRSYPPGPVGWTGDTGVEAAGGGTGIEGGITGAIGVPLGGETGGMIGPVGPAGP